ncbi:MAG: OmpA family protein [Candidatus Latescibacterota bacterium]
MALAKKLASVVQVGLLGLALLAGPAWTRTSVDEISGLSVGIRGGGVLPNTDLDGVLGPRGAVFARYGFLPGLQGELTIGYGRFITEDLAWVGPEGGAQVLDPAQTEEFKTDLSWVQLRAVYAPLIYERWSPYLYTGAGYQYFNVMNESLTPRRGDFDGIGQTLGVPLGIGARYELAPKIGVEASGGYTFTFSDQIDEADDGGKKDNYFEMTLGLTYDLTLGRLVGPVVEERAPVPLPVPVPAPVIPTADGDGDGLTDWDETKVYFTNPRMADSDGDGLTDNQEVQVHKTDPNRADSDGGGINDGAEIQRGTLALYAGDDAEVEEREVPSVPEVQIVLPVVNFPTGGAVLSAAAKQELDQTAQVLMQNPAVQVELRGYADNVGAPDLNQKLSQKRAQAVADYLVSKGVEASRLSVVGLGEGNPVADNATAEGRARNRRVELVQMQ